MSPNEGLSGTKLIQKLEIISGLYNRAISIQYKIDHFEPEDHYERTIKIPIFPGNYKDEAERIAWEKSIDHKSDQAIDMATAAYKRAYEPKEPPKPQFGICPTNQNKYAKDNWKKLGWLPIVAICIAVSFLIDRNYMILLPCAVAVGFFFLRSNKAKLADEAATKVAVEAYERDKREKEEKHTQDILSYQASMNAFNEESQVFVRAYTEWREIYLERRREEESIAEKLEEDRQKAVNAINEDELLPALQELNDINDLVSINYLPVLETIIDLLKDGRADDLKEAINLYEEIVYRERQLELEREKEDQRRRDEERHHREQMKFQQDQERQRQREEERRQQDAERRHKEEMDQRARQERDRQNEERRRADEERRRADKAELDRKQKEDRSTRDQCNRCAQVSHCSMAFRRPNCASFRPK